MFYFIRLLRREKQLESLEVEMAGKSDYEELRRELNVFKMIEFSSYDAVGAGEQQPLEILLLEKNRVLQNENTGLKNRLGEKSFTLENVRKL